MVLLSNMSMRDSFFFIEFDKHTYSGMSLLKVTQPKLARIHPRQKLKHLCVFSSYLLIQIDFLKNMHMQLSQLIKIEMKIVHFFLIVYYLYNVNDNNCIKI